MRIRQDVVVPLILLLHAFLIAEARGISRSFEKTFIRKNNAALERQYESVRELETRQASLPCTLNEQGFYGEPIGTVYEVEFIYEILVEPGTRISVIRVLVLPDLDKKITESILPSFFDCGTRRRRRLQTRIIQGASWRSQDLLVESGLSCQEPVDGADCYVVKGFLSVFAEGYDSMEEVEDAVLPVVRESMQSDELSSANDFLIGVDYVGADLFDLVPTVAPNGAPSPNAPTAPQPTSDSNSTSAPDSEPSSTLAPNSEPSSTPAPNSEPSSSTRAPNAEPSSSTRVPNTEPSATPAPNAEPSSSTQAPTSAPSRSFWPTWSETEFPTSSTLAPTLSPTTFVPTPSAPVKPSGPVAPPSSSNSTDVVTSESKEGLEKMEWWSWLLVAVGAAFLLLLCIGVLFGNSSGGPSKRAVRSDDGTDPTHIGTLSKFEQSRQEYIPPGADMDTFNISPSKHGSDDKLDESQEESTDNRAESAGGELGFSYGDEDARENDAVVEYEDDAEDEERFDDDQGEFEDGGAFEPDGDVYDDGHAYDDDEGDDGDYEDEGYDEEGEVYDDEEAYEDEEFDEEAEGQEHPDGPYEDEYDEGDEDYVEGDEGEVYAEDDENVSYDEESYYTEELEEEGPRWDSSFQVNRTNSL